MDLQGAVAHDEFLLVYQPIFDLRQDVPGGVEALIRWRRPGRGLVSLSLHPAPGGDAA